MAPRRVARIGCRFLVLEFPLASPGNCEHEYLEQIQERLVAISDAMHVTYCANSAL